MIYRHDGCDDGRISVDAEAGSCRLAWLHQNKGDGLFTWLYFFGWLTLEFGLSVNWRKD